ncbi:DUF6786 family protein [Paenibacillus chungangensis]|uniref:DUF6786 family protein n=1 Tax=Paenibacillus chungangensis TaxID=696535 RepID=A0ABW3HNU1_9BACL
MITKLESQLQQANCDYTVLHNDEGAHIILLTRGGRVLNVAASRSNSYAPFWTNPQAFASRHWNAGGDRTWISPELEYFIDDAGQYAIPTQLDPGSWNVTQYSSEEAALRMTCELHHKNANARVGLNLNKHFRLLLNPLHLNHSAAPLNNRSVRYVGYEVVTDLRLEPLSIARAEPSPGYCSLWSIMQLPADGTALIPTRGTVTPLTMFAEREPTDIKLLPEGAYIQCGGEYSFKLSFDAISSTGRYGYIRQLNCSQSSLVVRQFSVNPAARYPDYPPDNPRYLGSCMQIYHDGNRLGNFAELEYQSPALPIDRIGRMIDASQVFHFEGPSPAIHHIAEVMLGMYSR